MIKNSKMSHGGGRVRKDLKKCHILFEWPLKMIEVIQSTVIWFKDKNTYFFIFGKLKGIFFLKFESAWVTHLLTKPQIRNPLITRAVWGKISKLWVLIFYGSNFELFISPLFKAIDTPLFMLFSNQNCVNIMTLLRWKEFRFLF